MKKQKTWWWRKRDHLNPRKGFKPRQYCGHDLERVKERVAHHYELMRRCPEAKDHYQPYLKFDRTDPKKIRTIPLDRETATISYAYAGWASAPGEAYRFAFVQKMEKERGWTNTDPRIQWNLKLPNGTLTAQFIKYIDGWRGSKKVRQRRSLTGRINAKISWREIEILDRKQNHIGVLNSSERHTSGIALKKAAQLLIEFKRGRKNFLKRPKTSFDTLPDLEKPFNPQF